MPPLTINTRQQTTATTTYHNNHPTDKPENQPLKKQYTNFNIPQLGTNYNNYIQIFQTPNHITLFKKITHNMKLIPLDNSPHAPKTIHQ